MYIHNIISRLYSFSNEDTLSFNNLAEVDAAIRQLAIIVGEADSAAVNKFIAKMHDSLEHRYTTSDLGRFLTRGHRLSGWPDSMEVEHQPPATLRVSGMITGARLFIHNELTSYPPFSNLHIRVIGAGNYRDIADDQYLLIIRDHTRTRDLLADSRRSVSELAASYGRDFPVQGSIIFVRYEPVGGQLEIDFQHLLDAINSIDGVMPVTMTGATAAERCFKQLTDYRDTDPIVVTTDSSGCSLTLTSAGGIEVVDRRYIDEPIIGSVDGSRVFGKRSAADDDHQPYIHFRITLPDPAEAGGFDAIRQQKRQLKDLTDQLSQALWSHNYG